MTSANSELASPREKKAAEVGGAREGEAGGRGQPHQVPPRERGRCLALFLPLVDASVTIFRTVCTAVRVWA